MEFDKEEKEYIRETFLDDNASPTPTKYDPSGKKTIEEFHWDILRRELADENRREKERERKKRARHRSHMQSENPDINILGLTAEDLKEESPTRKHKKSMGGKKSNKKRKTKKSKKEKRKTIKMKW